MTRSIANSRKLSRIVEQHKKQNPKNPFIFSMGESLRIRQLIAESLVIFFALLNGRTNPGPQPIPKAVLRTKSRPKRARPWRDR